MHFRDFSMQGYSQSEASDKYVRKFAYLPQATDDGYIVWLEHVYEYWVDCGPYYGFVRDRRLHLDD